MGRAALLLAVGLLGGCEPVAISATPVVLDTADPQRRSVGALTYVAGWSLASEVSTWGGLSGLEAQALTGGVMLDFVTDQGSAGRMMLAETRSGGFDVDVEAWLWPLLENGLPLLGKVDADAEGLTELPDLNRAVSFERRHRIVTDPTLSEDTRTLTRPMVRLPPNGGFEGLATLPTADGPRLAVGAEDGRIWLCPIAEAGACAPLPLRRRLPALGYKLTSLDHLPDTSDLVATYRAYDPLSGWRWIVAWIDTGLPEGAPARIVELARFSPPLIVDNIEGIAALPLPGLGWRLFAVSDDNFSAEQRTLLLVFDWVPAAG